MQRRLAGKRILITRASEQMRDLAQQLMDEGAEVFQLPTIRIVPQPKELAQLSDALDRISSYQWLILTSVNTVTLLDEMLSKRDQNWSAFAALQIACIGNATAGKVNQLGGSVTLVPPRFQAESLAEELLKKNIQGKKILLPRAAGSRGILPRVLTDNGAEVDEIHIYRAEVADSSRVELERILQEQQIDFITFTSSSTVRNFFEIAADSAEKLKHTRIACIGPITAATLKEFGMNPDIIAEEFTIRGLVEAIASADPASPARPS